MLSQTVKRKPEILLLLASGIISLLVLDMILRLIMPPVYKTTRYGWTMGGDRSSQKTVEDSPGNFRNITASYYKNGFKRWGDVRTQKKKMLIIGDSFTEMNFVSNGEEWYSYLEKKFKNVELFVFGGGGYGSLQEFMVLADFLDEIRPDLILWQFCGNDYDNNLYSLDVRGYPHNNHAVRPYLENGKIVYRLPLPLATLRKYSFVANRLLSVYDQVLWAAAMKDIVSFKKKQKLKKLNASKNEQEEMLLLQQKAFAVTNEIMAKVRKRAGGIPLYLFNTSASQDEQEVTICKSNSITYIPGIAERISAETELGHEVKVVNGGHWNQLGNQVVGEQMADYFSRNKILDEMENNK